MKKVSIMLLAAGLLAALAACDTVTVEPIPSTGEELSLCFEDFKTCVDPIFRATINGRNGPTKCSGSGCHDIDTGSGGGFKVFDDPSDDGRLQHNFGAAQAFANLNSPSDSKLLLEPLNGVSAISGTHAGGDIFRSTGDACYQTILSWIANQVDNTTMQGCGVCTPPSISQCGF